jgi:hypothetical protein
LVERLSRTRPRPYHGAADEHGYDECGRYDHLKSVTEHEHHSPPVIREKIKVNRPITDMTARNKNKR